VALLHRNVPGVLAKLTSVLADHGLNIVGQSLSTRGEFGYVLTDTSGVSDDALETLRCLPETVRLAHFRR
jgi:D-3-phosphoglycerate dehydrogenase